MSDSYEVENEGQREGENFTQEVDPQYHKETSQENISGALEYDEPAQPIFRNAIRWLVYAAAFLLPLWFLPFTANVLEFNKQVLLVAFAGAGVVLYLLDIIKTGVWRYRPSRMVWPVLGLAGAATVSVIFSVSRYTSIFGSVNGRGWSLISLAALAALFILAINIIEDRGRILRKVLSVSLALAFIFALLQLFGLYLFKGAVFAQNSFNTIGTFNALGILSAIALGIFGAGVMKGNASESSKLDLAVKWSGYLGFVLALFFVILINWWVIWTVAFVAILASVAFQSASQVAHSGETHGGGLRKNRMRLFAPPLAIIVLGIFLMLVNFNWTSIRSKLPIEIAPSQKTSWQIAFDSLKSKPLGFGAENFGIAYDKFKPASIANTIFYQVRFTDSTSEVANMATEGGVLMLLAFAALLWFYGKELVVRVKKGVFSEDAGLVWAPLLALLVAMFLYPFTMAMMVVLVLFLALAALRDGEEERAINLETDAKYSFFGSLAFIAGLVLVLVVSYFTVNNYRANILLAKAQSAESLDKSIEYYVESVNSNQHDARALRLLSQTVLARLADELEKGPRDDETRESYNSRLQNLMATAVNISVRATNVDPSDAQNWANRGLVYQNLLNLIGGADQAAVNMYNESLARNPNDPQTYLRLGNLYLSIAENLQRIIANPPRNQQVDFSALRTQIGDNLNLAEENFKKAISLYNNFGQALYNLAAVYDRKGELGEAIKQFERLQSGNPNDPSMVFQLGLLYYRNNQKNNALAAWERAVFLFPNYSNARWYLSLILEERGDLEGSLAQVREIERLNPDNELVKQRLAQLEAGQRVIPPETVLEQEPLDQ